MKSTIVILATLVILALAAPACAQDWVMDWTSTGNVVTQPFTWRITDTSPQTSLIPVSTPPSLPPNFNGHVWALGFVWPTSGQGYGGLVAEGSFQTSDWSVPAPCTGLLNCRFSAASVGNFAGGTFNFTDANHFTLDVNLGLGHNNAHLVAFGSREGVTASTPEPATMAVGGIGLVVAALLRRQRQAS